MNAAIQKSADRKTRTLEAGSGVTADINPCQFLPDDRSRYFRYEGSLTTPEFDETVSWLVFPQYIAVKPGDVAALKENAHKSARERQPLNRRFVLRSFG